MITFQVDALTVHVHASADDLAAAAADDLAAALVGAIEGRGTANLMLAAGNSQRSMLRHLAQRRVDWARVVVLHMDEYVGVPSEHPHSFARFVRERFVDVVAPAEFLPIDGAAADADREAARYAAELKARPLDACALGIGENGHLAFNDPHVADFADPLDVKVVAIDDACKRQQVGEGHFPTVEAVPPLAITVTIPALLRAGAVVAVVPEARKALPVRAALEGPISPACPASALRTCARAVLHLDEDSAAPLTVSR